MSHFTTELRYICENIAGLVSSGGYSNVDAIIEKARPVLFENYEIFDEEYRATLETKILRHFYTREICAETVGLWRLWFNNRMHEIMPYYNKLYQSALLEFNPLNDIDITTEHTRLGNSTDTGVSSREYSKDDEANKSNLSQSKTVSNAQTNDSTTSNSISNNNTKDKATNASKDLYSDTPQGSVSGLDENTYLTNARSIRNDDERDTHNTQTNTGSNVGERSENGSRTDNVSNIENSTNNVSGNERNTNRNNVLSTEQYLQKVSGKQGGVSYAKMLKEYRDTFLNIDMMIINNLEDLFMGIWE